MENSRNETKILILCVLGAVVVIVLSIIALIGIWTGDNSEKAEKEQVVDLSLGNYQNIQYDLDKQVSNYSKEIITFLTTKNIDKLYAMANPEYLEYFKLDKEGLKKVLENKGFYGNTLTTSKYDSTGLDLNKYLRLAVGSINNDYIDGTINVIEYSPNDYKIAFDKFVFYKKQPIKYIREDLEIKISEQVAYDNVYNFNMSIVNNTDNTIYLNVDKEYDFICLVDSYNNNIGASTHMYANKVISLTKGKTVNLKLTFAIDDMAIDTIKSIVIKGVQSSKTGAVTDIELEI